MFLVSRGEFAGVDGFGLGVVARLGVAPEESGGGHIEDFGWLGGRARFGAVSAVQEDSVGEDGAVDVELVFAGVAD